MPGLGSDDAPDDRSAIPAGGRKLENGSHRGGVTQQRHRSVRALAWLLFALESQKIFTNFHR